MIERPGTSAAARRCGPAPDHGRVGEALRRRVLVVLCLTQITSWGVLYYAFPVMAPTIAADTGWSVPTATAAFSGGLVVSALVGIPVGRLAGPVRAARGDDGRVGGRGARGGRDRHRADVRGVPRRLAAGGGGDGGHAVPARVRRADPLVGAPARDGADRAHAGRRADQHDLRTADGRAARRAGLARHLSRAGARAGRRHGAGAPLGPARPLACARPARAPRARRPGSGRAQQAVRAADRGAHRWRVRRLRRAGGAGAAGDRARDVDDRGGVVARPRRRRPGARPVELRRCWPGWRACGRAPSACSPSAPRPPPCSASCPARRWRWSRRRCSRAPRGGSSRCCRPRRSPTGGAPRTTAGSTACCPRRRPWRPPLAPWAGAALAAPLGGYPGVFVLLAVVALVAAAAAVGSVPRRTPTTAG